MRRRLRGGALVAWMLAVWLVWPAASPVSAIAPEAYGWWAIYQQAPGGSNLPTPPGVPENGIFVSGAPATQAGQTVGVTSIGAVRARIAEGSPARILLSVANGYSGANAVLLACPTTSGWDPFLNGRWEARPKYDCVRGVQGTVSPTGDTVTFDMAGTAQKEPGLLDVAIVPGGPVRIAFERPGPSSIQPAFEMPFGDETSGDTTASSDSSGADDTSFAPSDGGFSEIPLGGALTELPAFGPDSGAGRGPLSPSGQAPVARGVPQALPGAFGLPSAVVPDERGERILALLLLLAIGAGLWWVGGQQNRPPRRLGSMGGAVPVLADVPARMGGVGRFARPRSQASPNRL